MADLPPPKPASPTEIALEYAASRPPAELVPLVLLLDEPGFDFRRFEMVKRVTDREERDLLRSELIAEREEQLEHANRGVVRERLTELGAEITRVLWINNSITVNVPAGGVRKVAAWPEVDRVFYQDPELVPRPGTSGLEMRSELLVGTFHTALYNGADGNDGTATGVKVAIVEANGTTNFLNRDHDGFDNIAGGSTRVTHLAYAPSAWRRAAGAGLLTDVACDAAERLPGATLTSRRAPLPWRAERTPRLDFRQF